MLPAFEIVGRQRPVAVVGVPFVTEEYDAGSAPRCGTAPTPHLAPFAAIEVALRPGRPATAAATVLLGAADGTELGVRLEGRAVSLWVVAGGERSTHRSRRHGRAATDPDRLALALTGRQLTALSHEDGAWVVRGRVDLGELDHAASVLDTRDPAWLSGLVSGWTSETVTGWTAGGFGQLGLRDLRVVSRADGTPYRPDGRLLVTATSAGPGFFDTAHTSVWSWEPGEARLRHAADLFFRRPDRGGAYGDHATHLLRDGDRWLVATSTWADFPADKRRRREATVGVTLAQTDADLTTGRHLLTTRELPLPTDGPSVGVWDPHLARTADGRWLVGYVSARRFFDFHPVLASGPELDDLALDGAATDRRATEGTTLLRHDDRWWVLASDGRDNPRRNRRRYPVFDTHLAEVGALAAPYPTNIPWPTVVPPAPGSADDWLLLTFDGRPYGGPLAGYGTHGEVVVMRPR